MTQTLGTDTVKVADAVRVLGVLFTPDLALEKHVTTVSAKCFFQLRQLRRVRRSLDHESTATLVHAFVTSRIDYGNALLANAPRTTTDKAAARPERRRPSHYCYTEVRSGFDAHPPR